MVLLNRRANGYAAIALTIALTGCSSSGGGNSTTAPAAIGGRSSPPAASTSSAPSGAGAGSLDAAAKHEITRAYKVFFDTESAAAESMTVLQHGTQFKQPIADERKSPTAQGITATVGKIVQQNAEVAAVTFSLFSSGNALLPNTHGFAVLEDGRWKVAAQTFCSLLNLEGNPAPICKDPSITSLPG